MGHDSTVLIISTPKSLSRVLWLLVVFTGLTAWISNKALEQARSVNQRATRVPEDLRTSFNFKTDPFLGHMTREYFSNGCEIGRFETCDQVEDSETVQLMRHLALPPTAEKLLSVNRYSSAYHLFKDLSIHGADEEIPKITSSLNIDIESLSRFAVYWYLAPAISYAKGGRERDALRAYALFADVLRSQIQQGRWLSQKGVDATDLPVLTDLFCPTRDEDERDDCVLSVLKAISDLADDSFVENDESSYDSILKQGIPTETFLRALESVGSNRQTSTLETYLALWTAPEQTALHVTRMIGASAPQQQAWTYASAVVTLQRAQDLHGSDEAVCRRLVDQSRKLFTQVAGFAVTDSYFAGPAVARLKYLQEHAGSICQNQKSSAQAK